jgi:hypothetical protein
MTRILYTAETMISKPNDPEECINLKKASLWTDTKVNYWFFIAVVVGLANAILFHPIGPPLGGVLREDFLTWPVGIRLIIESVPLLAGLLWARSWVRFIRGMDELHRRITIEAWLFSALATIGFISIWPMLDAAGISGSVYYATHFHEEFTDKPHFFPVLWLLLDKPPSIFRILWLLYAFFIPGYFILIRRYK